MGSSTSSISSSSSSSSSSFVSPFPLPKADASKEIWQKFLKDSTEGIYGSSPYEARLICLGDVHTETWQDAWRDGLIDHFGSDGDIVLVEGWGAEKRIFPMISNHMFHTQKKIEAYGWDDVDLVRKTKAAIRTLVDLKERYQERAFSEWSAEDRLAWNKASEEIEDYGRERTYTMTKTARSFLKTLKPGQKIFLIAGSDHLYNSNGYKIVNAMHSEKIALLLPQDVSKDSSADLIQAKKLLGSGL